MAVSVGVWVGDVVGVFVEVSVGIGEGVSVGVLEGLVVLEGLGVLAFVEDRVGIEVLLATASRAFGVGLEITRPGASVVDGRLQEATANHSMKLRDS